MTDSCVTDKISKVLRTSFMDDPQEYQMARKSSHLFGSAHLFEHGDGAPEGCGADAGLRADGAEDGRQRREAERHDAAGAGRNLQDAAANARQAAPPLEPIQLRNELVW